MVAMDESLRCANCCLFKAVATSTGELENDAVDFNLGLESPDPPPRTSFRTFSISSIDC